MLAWMVEEKDIEPHVPVWDKTERKNDSFSSNDFHWNEEAEEYRSPADNALRSEWRAFARHQSQHHHLPIQADRLRDMSDESQVLPEHFDSQDRPQRP